VQTESDIRIIFEDQGIGIPDEHLPFIFERFYRAAPSANGEAHSGGLGLAIAQAIVRALGGSIQCQRAGTRIDIYDSSASRTTY
jgi:signal transduction histidine kinase